MPEPLAVWGSFYVIVGSSAAALTGLMFVVIALVAESDVQGSSRTISAFSTPNIMHFCAALLVSATLSSPWPTLWGASVAVGIYGICGAMYTSLAIRDMRMQRDYAPVFEDWLWHGILPFAAYATLMGGAAGMRRAPATALFACAAATIGLVFIGIHNAWDTVTYLAIQRRTRKNRDE